MDCHYPLRDRACRLADLYDEAPGACARANVARALADHLDRVGLPFKLRAT